MNDFAGLFAECALTLQELVETPPSAPDMTLEEFLERPEMEGVRMDTCEVLMKSLLFLADVRAEQVH